MLTKNGHEICCRAEPRKGVAWSQDTAMDEQRIFQQADGWHFKIRGGNTVGPFEDCDSAERAVANYARRWQQRTSAAPCGWRNWRRSPSPLAVVSGASLDVTGHGATPIDGKPTPNMRTGS